MNQSLESGETFPGNLSKPGPNHFQLASLHSPTITGLLPLPTFKQTFQGGSSQPNGTHRVHLHSELQRASEPGLTHSDLGYLIKNSCVDAAAPALKPKETGGLQSLSCNVYTAIFTVVAQALPLPWIPYQICAVFKFKSISSNCQGT